jgi:hypothetical protein
VRLALSLTLAALSVGCSVPDVQFSPDGADATTDGDADGAADGSEASSDAGQSDDGRIADAIDDLGYDGPLYCNGGPMPPTGACCPMNGPPCVGSCTTPSCKSCGPCTWPKVCCTSGPTGMCKMPPC